MEQSEVIRIRNGKVYAHNELIINSLNMSLVEGEFCYLFGPNGSGKSTFFKALFGLEKIQATETNVIGYDINELNKHQMQDYRRQLGIISNFYPLIGEKTVYDNLDIILQATGWNIMSKRDERINDLLKNAGIIKRAQSLVGELSAGEQVIIKILRAMLNGPKLILADGITSLLDNQLSEQVLNLLRDLALKNGSTILLATHRHELIEQYPARTYLCRSRVIEEM